MPEVRRVVAARRLVRALARVELGVLRARRCAALVLALAALASSGASSTTQAPASPAPYTVLSREGRRPLPARVINGQEMVALDDLAGLFEISYKEDALAGGLTVTVRGRTIVLSAAQPLVSVGGRVISLPAPPARDGRTWYVPIDFVSRALAPLLGTPLELRKPSRLIIVGGVRMPRVAGRVEPLGSLARLTLDIAPATPHTVAREGSRLVIRFEADALDAALPASTAPELIQAVRPGESPASIAVDLGPRFGTYRASDVPSDRGAGRLVIDVLAAATEQQPPQQQQPPPAGPEAPPVLDLAPAGGVRTVVIDPGHGGNEHGSRGRGGALEKDVTLAVARRLKSALETRLGVRAILTRDGDSAVGLEQRAAVANNNKADVFVSLHANASVRAVASGAEIFYLSLEEYGDRARRIAKSSSETLPVVGGGMRDIEVIPWQLAQAHYIEQSEILARALQDSFRERIPLSARGVQQAPLRVLVGANMPAVLIEMGFLTNPGQEQQLTSAGHQDTLALAIVDAIVRFRDQGGRR
jgi:N-acetylmuramoyl-L-alanine amidase